MVARRAEASRGAGQAGRWGQEKRRTAAILAEMHNVSRIEAWAKSIDPKQTVPPPMPTLLNENHFLPRRVKKKVASDPAKVQSQREKALQNLSTIMNSLCGYR